MNLFQEQFPERQDAPRNLIDNPWIKAGMSAKRRCTVADRAQMSILMGIRADQQQRLLKAGYDLLTVDTETLYVARLALRPEDCGCPNPGKELVLELQQHSSIKRAMDAARAIDQDEEKTIVSLRDIRLTARSAGKLLHAGYAVWKTNEELRLIDELNEFNRWEPYTDLEQAIALRNTEDHIEVGNLLL